MAHIVNLADYRKPARTRPPVAGADAAAPGHRAEPHYYCLRCDTDSFKLLSNGVVHCAHCGARMRNLGVSEKAGTQSSDLPT
jgi:ribosomal protein L37E